MRIALTLLFTLSFNLDVLAQALNFNSPRCQELTPTNALEISDCHPEFVLQSQSALNDIAQSSENMTDYFLGVGTIENLSQIVKLRLQDSHLESFRQKLILAKGFGKDLSQVASEISNNTCIDNSLKEDYLRLISAVDQQTTNSLESNRQAYLKELKSAFVEITRLNYLIEQYENSGNFPEELEQARSALRALNTYYPILIHRDSIDVADSTRLVTQRILQSRRATDQRPAIPAYHAPENIMLHANQTSDQINSILSMPFEIPTRLPHPRGRQVRGLSAYDILHHRIHDLNIGDAQFDREIPEMAMESLNSSLSGLNHICEADPCETFALIPHTIPQLTNTISHSNTRDRVEKFVCNCEIRREDPTLPLSVHLGIVAGTVGLGIGCIAFAPLCIGATAVGMIGVGAGVSDYLVTDRNTQRVEQEYRLTTDARGILYSEFEEDRERLEEAYSNRTSSAAFAFLDVTGGVGDFVVVGGRVVTGLADSLQGARINPPQSLPTTARSVARQTPISQIQTRDTLVRQFEPYDPVSDEMRSAWIARARSNSADLFFDMENGMLKRLNDLGDKEAITALTNVHKRLVMEGLEGLRARYPQIDFSLYSDFKSMRLAISGDIPPELRSELTAIFNSANEEVSELVQQLVARGELSFPAGENPRTWFAGGFGESADQAGIAAREARCRTGEVCIPVRDFNSSSTQDIPSVVDNLNQARRSLEESRQTIISRLQTFQSNTPLTTTRGGVTIPSVDVIEVVRKNMDKSPEEVARLINRRFGIEVNTSDAQEMIDYMHSLKRFEPGLWTNSRQVASLEEASFGGFSADFTGMGSYNLEQVAIDLAQGGEDVQEVLRRLRAGEQTVTSSFNQRKEFFEEISRRAYEQNGVEVNVICSGDDCVSYPRGDLGISRGQQRSLQESLVREINSSQTPDGFRLAFVPPGTPQASRSRLAVHGEAIEKAVRKISFGADAIPFEQSQNLTIAVRMPTSLGQGQVEILVAGLDRLNLNPEQLAATQTRLRAYVDEAIRNSVEIEGGHNYALRDVLFL